MCGNGCSQSVVFEVPPAKYTAERIFEILQDSTIEDDKVCKTVPTGVTSSLTFVVDNRFLKNPDDIKKDELGIWNYSGSHPQTYKESKKDGIVEVEKCTKNSKGDNIYHVVHIHRVQTSND